MLCACINAQRHVLLRFTGGDSKLNREWRSTLHHGFSSLEQMPRLCRRARHQGLTAHVQNKYFQSISFADTRRFRLHGPKAGLTSFANVGRGLVPATPLLPLRAFNHRPQSVELGCTSHGAYTFPTNVAPLERGALRLVNKGAGANGRRQKEDGRKTKKAVRTRSQERMRTRTAAKVNLSGLRARAPFRRRRRRRRW